MIVSHKHKFIFMKTVKTASSSMEIALSNVCGPDDIITPTRGDLEDQRATAGQNFRIEHPMKPQRPLWRRLLRRPERLYHPSVGFYEHMPAFRAKAYLGDEIWNSYFKFAFVRNPWDAQVSIYFYKTRGLASRPTFEAFLRNKRQALYSSWNIYTIDDVQSVDVLGRYETVAEDFTGAMRRIGLNGLDLPFANVSDKPKDRYREFYSSETRDLVASWYAKEIAAHGYTF
jgi:Sulfotransferase family